MDLVLMEMITTEVITIDPWVLNSHVRPQMSEKETKRISDMFYVICLRQFYVLLLIQDTFFRYLKSPTYKDIQKKALTPEVHNFRWVYIQ